MSPALFVASLAAQPTPAPTPPSGLSSGEPMSDAATFILFLVGLAVIGVVAHILSRRNRGS